MTLYCPTCWHTQEEHVLNALGRRPCTVRKCGCRNLGPAVHRARMFEMVMWAVLGLSVGFVSMQCDQEPVPTVKGSR